MLQDKPEDDRQSDGDTHVENVPIIADGPYRDSSSEAGDPEPEPPSQQLKERRKHAVHGRVVLLVNEHTRVTLRLAKLVSTSRARHSRV
jgi:hypothetical protein